MIESDQDQNQLKVHQLNNIISENWPTSQCIYRGCTLEISWKTYKLPVSGPHFQLFKSKPWSSLWSFFFSHTSHLIHKNKFCWLSTFKTHPVSKHFLLLYCHHLSSSHYHLSPVLLWQPTWSPRFYSAHSHAPQSIVNKAPWVTQLKCKSDQATPLPEGATSFPSLL